MRRPWEQRAARDLPAAYEPALRQEDAAHGLEVHDKAVEMAQERVELRARRGGWAAHCPPL
jgi:hypothetical protein